MKKALICIVLIAVATVAWLIWGTSDAAAIDKVLSQTHGLTHENFDSLPFKDQLDWLARGMRSIDTSKCPADFRFAYEMHIQAIENAYDVYLNEPKGVLDNLFSGSSFQSSQHKASERFDSTRENVNALAAKYGAKKKL